MAATGGAMNETSVALAALGIVASVCAGMVWAIRYVLTRLSADLREHTKAAVQTNHILEKLGKNVEKNSVSTDKNTKATESFEQYLRDRNGRDGTVHEYLLAGMAEVKAAAHTIPAEVAKEVKLAMQNIAVQKVDTQVIEQHVDGKK